MTESTLKKEADELGGKTVQSEQPVQSELVSNEGELNVERVLPEAGGIAFMTMYSKTGVPINVTARGFTAQEAVAQLMNAVVWAMGEYGMTVDKPMPPAATPPAVTKDVQIAMQEGNKQLAVDLQNAQLEVPPSRKGADVSYKTLDLEIVEVLPQPDDKVTIKFYGKNDQYPRITATKWTLERASSLMKYVTSEPMSKPAKYTVFCRVYYTDGKEYTNQNGEKKHYMDIEHVRPL